MLIKDFRKSEDCFGHIVPGIVFAVDDSFYMAIEPIEKKELDVPFNAVNLETGELVHYFDDTVIQIIEAELYVR